MNKWIKCIGVMLIVVVLFGCSEEEKVPIGTHFYVPNTFTPNNDGLNDTFRVYPIYGFAVRDFHISIYDQSLRQVYSSNDVYTGWNGKLNGADVPQGYYDYQIIYQASQLLDSTSTDTVYSDYVTSSTINLFRE